MWENLKVVTLKGQEIHPYINDLAKLRIKVFKDYPYLYEGDLLYESDYLKTYIENPESTMAVVLDGKKAVGMATSIPLEFETLPFQKPFIEHDLPIKKYFYFGESVLLRAYRGQGIYPHFFQIREQAARDYGCEYATFCAVERQSNDKRKPPEYRPLDSYWQKIGYKKHPELSTQFEWKEIDETIATPKKMIFWIKKL